MISTSLFQHAIAVRPVASSYCTHANPVATPWNMAWLGGIGSKVTTIEFGATKRPTTRPLVEVLT